MTLLITVGLMFAAVMAVRAVVQDAKRFAEPDDEISEGKEQ